MTKTDISSCDDERNKSILKKMRSPPKLLTKENALSTGISTITKYNSPAKNSPTKEIIVDKNQDFSQPLAAVISQSNQKNNTPKFFSVKRALFETHETFNHGNDESSNKRHYSKMKSPIRKKTTKDIDQDFSQPLSQSYHNKNDNSKFSLEKALSETDDFNQENAESPYSRHTILNYPIGKIVVENNDQSFSYSHSRSQSNDRNNKSEFSSAKRTTIFDTIETDEIFNQDNTESSEKIYSILNSPIGKIVVKDNDKNFSQLHSMSQSNNKNRNTPRFSSAKTSTDKLMLNCDFQTFVINLLTKMKYDISGINSKTNATHILLNSYVTSSGNSIIQGQLNNNQISKTSDYYNLLPIQTKKIFRLQKIELLIRL
ncbi:unnamed protein product [Macrosiphum euphorbiae]|uniref:Uncharacterized protein n=1 Tax=Macrosiphum euphorbiae TaxID=13131 RepID=A0AAV0Y715_9HEMI|nr:unnamed protein product [Macrosiphum euphorbiae]